VRVQPDQVEAFPPLPDPGDEPLERRAVPEAIELLRPDEVLQDVLRRLAGHAVRMTKPASCRVKTTNAPHAISPCPESATCRRSPRPFRTRRENAIGERADEKRLAPAEDALAPRGGAALEEKPAEALPLAARIAFVDSYSSGDPLSARRHPERAPWRRG